MPLPVYCHRSFTSYIIHIKYLAIHFRFKMGLFLALSMPHSPHNSTDLTLCMRQGYCPTDVKYCITYKCETLTAGYTN